MSARKNPASRMQWAMLPLALAVFLITASQGETEDVVPDPERPFRLEVPAEIEEVVAGAGNLQIVGQPIAGKVHICVNGGDIQINGGGIVIDEGGTFVLGGLQAHQPEAPNSGHDLAGPHMLAFENGARLHGTLAALNDTEVVWNRADTAASILLPQSEIASVFLAGGKVEAARPPSATLMLRNGDWMTGEVFNFREGKWEFRMPSGTKLELKSDDVAWVYLADDIPPDVFSGPVSSEGWFFQGNWTVRNGVISNKGFGGSFSRVFSSVPDKMDYQFDVDAGDVPPNFMITLHSPDNSGMQLSEVWSQIRFQGRNINLWSYSNNNSRSENVNLPEDEELNKNKHRYRILEDRTGGRMMIYIDGKKVTDWKLDGCKKGAGGGHFTFQPMRWSSNARWKFSQIKLLPWDGREPNKTGATTPEGVDVVVVEGQGTLTGKLISILGAVVKFRHAKGEENFPRDKVSLIRLRKELAAAQAPAEKIAPAPGQVPPAEPKPGAPAGQQHKPRFFVELTHRGQIIAQGARFEEGRVVLECGFSATLSLDPDEVRCISFENTPPPRKFFSLADNAKSKATDVLVFQNGDELAGSLVEAGDGSPLKWKMAYKEQMPVFQADGIGGVLMANGEAGGEVLQTRAVARFRNGDWLSGLMQSMDKEKIVFKTAFSENLSMPRDRVETLYLDHGEVPAVWDGARDREGWLKGRRIPGNQGEMEEPFGKLGSRRWLYLDGAYSMKMPRSNGWNGNGPGIGRIFESLPGKVDVRFDVSCDQDNPSFNMQLFYSKQNGGYVIQGYEGGLYIYDMAPRKGGRGAFGGQGQQFEFSGKVAPGKRHKYRFLCDREQNRIHCLVDGVLVGVVGRANKGAEEPLGTGMSLSLQNYTGSWSTFSHIWVAPWSGRLPESAKVDKKKSEGMKINGQEKPAAAEKPAEAKPAPSQPAEVLDAVAFANGDEALCKIESADGEILKVQFEEEPLEIARSRVHLIEFGSGKEPDFPMGIRIRFTNGGILTLQSYRVSDGKVICKSAALGEQTIPLSAVSEVVLRRLSPNVMSAAEENQADGSGNGNRRVRLQFR